MTTSSGANVREMRTWDVPAVDDANHCWVAWSIKLNGYFLGTRTPEGEMFATDGYASLATLMVATAPAVEWSGVAPSVIAELHKAPSLAYLDEEHTSGREQSVAMALRLALPSLD